MLGWVHSLGSHEDFFKVWPELAETPCILSFVRKEISNVPRDQCFNHSVLDLALICCHRQWRTVPCHQCGMPWHHLVSISGLTLSKQTTNLNNDNTAPILRPQRRTR